MCGVPHIPVEVPASTNFAAKAITPMQHHSKCSKTTADVCVAPAVPPSVHKDMSGGQSQMSDLQQTEDTAPSQAVEATEDSTFKDKAGLHREGSSQQQQESLDELHRSGLVRQRAERLEKLSGLFQERFREHAEAAARDSAETPERPSASASVMFGTPADFWTSVPPAVEGSGALTPISSPHGSTLTRSSSSDSIRSIRGKPGLVRQRAQEIEVRMRLAGLTVPSRLKRSNSLAKLGSLTFSTEDLCSSACSSDAGTLLLLTLSPEPEGTISPEWDRANLCSASTAMELNSPGAPGTTEARS